MTNVSAQDPKEDSKDIPPEELAEHLAEAKHLLRQGDHNGAVHKTIETLQMGNIGLEALTEFYEVLRQAGREDIADDMRTHILAVLDQIENDRNDDAVALLRCGVTRLKLEDTLGSERQAKRVLELTPADHNALFLYAISMLKNDTFVLSRLDPDPALDTVLNPIALLSGLASLLAHYDRKDDALSLLDQCQAMCTESADQARIDTVRAGLTDQNPDIDQRAMATNIFDKFAENYDQQLTNLGNNGPQVIATGLEMLGLAKDGSRDIFDAGCGTGLCAPYLRPYARHIHGVDLSIPMLEKCLEKGTFDLLARTDLAVRDTFPEGEFDMVVSGDVLVYFGALDTVFQNLFDILRPGGRFIFTVEEAPDPAPARGYAFTASGRNHHSEAYVRSVLEKVGFGPADLVHRDTLRFEFGKPIKGMAISACKPA